MSVHLVLPKKVKTPYPTPPGTPRLACGAQRKAWTELSHTSYPKEVQVTCRRCIKAGVQLGLMPPPKTGPTRRELEVKHREILGRQVRKENIRFIAAFRNLIGE